ncbi:hypothetical protein Dimus_023411 [Dionaea muscipula]
MDQKTNQSFQIFIQSTNPQSPIRALTLALNETIHDLKRSLLSRLFPQSLSSMYYLSLNGRTLDSSNTAPLSSIISPFSTLTVHFKLLGGGGDGGATGAESRDCYLNMYAIKKPDKVDPNEQRLSKWTNCALSFEPLKPPCVIDRLGNVFNKEALVRSLIGKNLPKEFSHIKGLKDMIDIQLSLIPGVEFDDGLSERTRFQCPISGLEFNGKYKFFALRKCGHVLSAKALKEVKSSACLVCHMDFEEDDDDKVVINGNEEEVEALRLRMEDEKAKGREKKVKKMKNGGGQVVKEEEEEDVSGLETFSKLTGMKRGKKEKLLSGKIVNGGVVAKRFKAVDVAPAHANKQVYASIFTSSSKKSSFKETYSCRSLPLGRN